ncbi:hypothetical protein HXX76_009454 [Chlamydomonas incerta]|uniref:EGF-like domain-containing protein n=1 Tax=Chlamydomonas incerta TaxID=51695 RepID=A0A835SQQ0_CHLIN|nr:hypothetical protein HXX76_009454 [Chlamydomonas incerta]|eukprot:KAG2431439.1 hypothetical protein HXX76_009454 [Chlamydomonas incerta]
MYGFCKCHLGWYGMDCARRRASSAPIPKAAIEEVIPKHHQNVATFPVAARDPPPAPTRRRPLIYMYDLDPLFNTRMLQYRLVRTSCLHRMFKPDNSSSFVTHGYSIETYFTEVLMTSAHRTYDPEEADFFFVPLLVTCYFWPVLGWSDHPWFGMPLAIVRPHQGAYMYRDAKRWIQQQHPWWDRRGGRDHIWMTAHDEGACWLPTEIYNTSIILTHWGRMDDVHVSGTAWGYDNYSAPLPPWPPHVEGDWRDIYDGHPCYTPGKDLVIPLFKPPGHYAHSPLMGAPPLQRDILLYLRGDTGPYRAHWYSRGIRQRLAKLGYMHDWAEKHRIFVGEQFMIPGTYSEHLARSVFCVVAPGDGYSGRGEDAVLHGCIPLIIMDGVHAVFESIIDWSAFSIRIAESAVNEQLPQFLKSISPAQIELMQRKIAMVWHRFAYTTGPLMQDNLAATYGANRVLRRHVRNLLPVNAVEADTRRTLDTVQRLTRGGMLPVPGWLGLDSIKEQNGTGVAWQGQPDGEWLGPVGHPQRAYRRFPVLNDAWHTILAWLHSRIPSTR